MLEKLLRIIQNHYKIISAFVLGILVSGIVVYAETILAGKDVSYDNSQSHSSYNNVQGAIEDLYQRSDLSSGSCTEGQSNFIVAYIYDPSTCLTGAESTCKVTTCYKNKNVGSCEAGTIIEYRVNDSTIKTFHVLHDDGIEITMQQRESTIYNVVWNDYDDKTKGPVTVLSKLEEATKDWKNVKTQTYTMGTTDFNGTNSYTGCSYIKGSSDVATCTMNVYTLEKRSGKSRLITVQEALKLGCQYIAPHTCPNFMNNYLYNSINNGGTMDDKHLENGASNNSGYWTMNTISSSYNHVFAIVNDSSISRSFTTKDLNRSVRAVVVVSK